LKRTATAVRAAVAISRENRRQSPDDASQRLQADSAIALGTVHSHREFRAPSTREDTVLAWCDMRLCSEFNFRRRDDGWVAIAETTALSHQRGANGTTSNGRHELLSPLTADRAAEQRPRDRQSCYPHGFFMGEKSGFAKAETLENE
jgi:hypothetical protein